MKEMENNLSLSELKDLLCEIHQLISGWNATEKEWSEWDKEVEQKIYNLQLKLEGKEIIIFK